MDYEKKYKEALDRARIYRDNAKAVEEYSAVARYENIFPELREKPLTSFQQCLNSILLKVYYASVPGKVDKFISDIIKNRTDELVELAKRHEYTNCQLNKSKDEEIRQQLLWLCDEWEHNPERRTIPADIGNIKQIRRYLEKQKEQKSVDYDHEMWKNCEANFEGGKKEVIEHPEKYGLQKPAEWSEEDEENIDSLIIILHKALSKGISCKEEVLDLTDWLNNLRPSWKPSEEQMNCLCAAVDAAIRKHNESVGGYKPARVLKSLYEDLQKL